MRAFTARGPRGTAANGRSSLGLRAGEALPAVARSFFDSRFAHDFSRVRVHAGDDAASLAASHGARAMTAGSDIAFAAGEYDPYSSRGRRLLAHELAHVVQQERAPRSHSLPPLSAPGDAAEHRADTAAETVLHGGTPRSPGPPAALVHRSCGQASLGAPAPACQTSTAGAVGWPFQFQPGCDDLLPGQEANINQIRHHNRLLIHGYASSTGDGPAGFLNDLSCHRANKIADLARSRRPDCQVGGVFAHGVRSGGTGTFGQMAMVEQVRDTNVWLNPTGNLDAIRAQLAAARANPASANLGALAARRPEIRTWLDNIPTNVAPAGSGVQLDRQDQENYRNFYSAAEHLWRDIDTLLVAQNHPAAATDTYQQWAVGPGTPSGLDIHIHQPLPPAVTHVDIFGEGYFPGAINLGMATRTSTTGINNSRVPNAIFRQFTANAAQNGLPFTDHSVDLVTAENGPIQMAGLAAEIARIIAPGGTIILNNPVAMEPAHDAVARAVGGTVTKTPRPGSVPAIETRIVAPAAAAPAHP